MTIEELSKVIYLELSDSDPKDNLPAKVTTITALVLQYLREFTKDVDDEYESFAKQFAASQVERIDARHTIGCATMHAYWKQKTEKDPIECFGHLCDCNALDIINQKKAILGELQA